MAFSTLFWCGNALAQDAFVLKTGEGEAVLNGIVIKVSPQTGSEGSILLEQTFQHGGSTNLHVHDQGDEIIYVVSGKGHARVGDAVQLIEAGDVIFVPRGHVHQVGNMDFDEPLRAVAFMDSPELVEEVRAIHARIQAEPDGKVTDEEIARIAARIGGSRPVEE